MKKIGLAATAAVAGLTLAGCAIMNTEPNYDAEVAKMMSASFRDQGIATVDRLQQDTSNAACSAAQAQGRELAPEVSASITDAAMKSVRPPSDGKYIGDWRQGERLAQNGRGMTWSDPSAASSANGGNCYNCHQISKSEISFGTIGPSLYNYGKIRGVTDIANPNSAPIIQYTWAKLYNAKAFNACSGMPRFGHGRLLDEKQLKDVMALILDPRSPVNQ